MTLSILMYALMLATFVALAGVLAFDAATAVLRWSARARQVQPAAAATRRPAAPGARGPRVASTKT